MGGLSKHERVQVSAAACVRRQRKGEIQEEIRSGRTRGDLWV